MTVVTTIDVYNMPNSEYRRMLPALEGLGIDCKTAITVKPLHNLFAPRLEELPGLVDGLLGAPGS
jgi:hypothetical protein